MTTLDRRRVTENLGRMLKALFPIPRTLISDGFDESLRLIRNELPMDVHEYASGEQVWDWTVPNAWNVREAYIADPQGKRIIDYKDSNIHLSVYSMPFRGRVTKEELFKHIKYLKDQPDAIPYNNLYYRKDWEFNISQEQLSRFTSDHYDVVIDVDSRPGKLKIGECYLPGESQEEIFFSTYLCHPSMANDNLSGPLACLELFKYLKSSPKRKYSYRLIIIPETIGAIAYLARNENHLRQFIKGGINVYICGDPGPLTYKKTYAGNTLIDRAASLALKQSGKTHSVRPFVPLGSDERQYNAPGVRFPVGALTRTPPAEFKQYHTSKDDLTLVTPETLFDTVGALIQIIQVLEANETYVNRYKGEPFLSKHHFAFESFHDIKNDASRNYFRLFINEIDGRNSLLDIAEKWNIPMAFLTELAQKFESDGLIAKTTSASANLASLYDENYFGIYRADIGSPQQKKRFASYEQEYARIAAYCQGGNVLDVGCGLGDFLELFPTSEWKRYGIEISPYASQVAASKGIQMELPMNPAGFFDLIIFRGTIQHLDEPMEMIKKAIAWLKPGGYMVFLATPNTGGLYYRLFQEHPALNPKYNFMLVSDKSLRQILENFGMEIQRFEFPYIGSPYANPPKDLFRFVLRCLGIRKPFAFWGNMMECYAQKPIEIAK